jgi:hypothetical protein
MSTQTMKQTRKSIQDPEAEYWAELRRQADRLCDTDFDTIAKATERDGDLLTALIFVVARNFNVGGFNAFHARFIEFLWTRDLIATPPGDLFNDLCWDTDPIKVYNFACAWEADAKN